MRDLKAAKSFGLKTIYVERDEDREPTTADAEYVDMFASDFLDAASQLGLTS